MFSKKVIKIYNFFAALIFLFFSLELFAVGQKEPGWIVFLDGTSSAGKSSVARQLKDKLLKQMNKPFEYESRDDFRDRKDAEEAARQTAIAKTEEMNGPMQKTSASKKRSQHLQRSIHYDEDDEEADSQEASDDDYDDGSIADYLQYLVDSARNGKNMIADTVLMDDHDVSLYTSIIGKWHKTVCAMIVCPFKEILFRVQARNRSGIKGDHRSIYQAIAQVPDMFVISRKKTAKTIDEITKKDVEVIFTSLRQELKDDNAKKIKEGKKTDDINEVLDDLRSQLLPKKCKQSFIHPRIAHDIVVFNESISGPAVAAQKIVDYLVAHASSDNADPFKKNLTKRISKDYSKIRGF